MGHNLIISAIGIAIGSIIINLIIGCDRQTTSYHALPNNIELKNKFYNSIGSIIDSQDSIFNFEHLCEDPIDSILIFPSYTSMHKIKSYLGDVEIEEFSRKEMLGENQDLFIFKKDGEILYYFILDSLYAVPDLKINAYSTNNLIRIQTFDNSESKKGAYLIPLLAVE